MPQPLVMPDQETPRFSSFEYLQIWPMDFVRILHAPYSAIDTSPKPEQEYQGVDLLLNVPQTQRRSRVDWRIDKIRAVVSQLTLETRKSYGAACLSQVCNLALRHLLSLEALQVTDPQGFY